MIYWFNRLIDWLIHLACFFELQICCWHASIWYSTIDWLIDLPATTAVYEYLIFSWKLYVNRLWVIDQWNASKLEPESVVFIDWIKWMNGCVAEWQFIKQSITYRFNRLIFILKHWLPSYCTLYCTCALYSCIELAGVKVEGAMNGKVETMIELIWCCEFVIG